VWSVALPFHRTCAATRRAASPRSCKLASARRPRNAPFVLEPPTEAMDTLDPAPNARAMLSECSDGSRSIDASNRHRSVNDDRSPVLLGIPSPRDVPETVARFPDDVSQTIRRVQRLGQPARWKLDDDESVRRGETHSFDVVARELRRADGAVGRVAGLELHAFAVLEWFRQSGRHRIRTLAFDPTLRPDLARCPAKARCEDASHPHGPDRRWPRSKAEVS
jgi:hypothetical protein